MELPESLRAARFLLLRERPYMAAAAFALIPVEVPGLGKRALGDIGLDRFWRLYYDPEGIGRWSTEQLVGVLYHELWHLLNAHAERLVAWPAHIANLGGDLAINSIVKREGLCLPEDGVLPEQFGFPPNLTAQEYCERLQQQADSLPAESWRRLCWCSITVPVRTGVQRHGSCLQKAVPFRRSAKPTRS
jgi:predicted metal-dependent peptidase